MLELAAIVIMYDHGYQKLKSTEGLTRTWARRLDDAFVSEADQHPLKAKHKGRTAYTDKLKRAELGYIHELYRKSERTLGNQTSFEDLARNMNAWSKVPGETRFNAINVFRWFRQ